MAETEAACLLRTGALYARRIGLKRPDGSLVFAGLKRGAFSLYFDDAPIYHFDLEGRWQRLYRDGIHYRKSLDNATDSLDRVREGSGLVIQRRTLPFAELADLDDSVRRMALDLSREVASGGFDFLSPPGGVEPMPAEELIGLLDRIASWDASAWFAHRERYLAAYGPGAIVLPPDAQNAIVLQATVGAGFFRTPQEFGAHVRDVAKLLGRRAIAASSVFLADGAVLARPLEDLIRYLEAIQATFPIESDSAPKRPGDRPFDRPSLAGVEVMLDGELVADPPNEAGWRSLAANGVRRLTVRSRAGVAIRGIEEAKSAGLAVSVWVESDSNAAGAINALPLGPGDLLYLGHDGGESAAIEAFRGLLGPVRERGAKVVPYNPAKQWS